MHYRWGTDPCMGEGMQIVMQSEGQPITRIQAQRRSFVAVAVEIAVTGTAMIKDITVSNVHFEPAVLTTKILRLGDFGAGRRT